MKIFSFTFTIYVTARQTITDHIHKLSYYGSVLKLPLERFSSQKFKERQYHKRLIAAVSASARCISANDYIIRNNYKWSKCMNTQDFLKVWLIIFLLQPRTLIMKYLNIVSSAFSDIYIWKQKGIPTLHRNVYK